MQGETPNNKIFWFFLVLFTLSFILLGFLLKPFFSILILGAVVAGVFRPVYSFFSVPDKINSSFASFLTCCVIMILLFVPLTIFIGVLAEEAYNLFWIARDAITDERFKQVLINNTISEKIVLLFSKFNITITSEDFVSPISKLGETVGLYLLNKANFIVANALKIFISFFMMLIITFYLLMDGNKLVEFLINLSPLPRDQDEMLIHKFSKMSGAVLVGNGICGLIQGLLGGLAFALLNLPSPFLWGIIMSLLAFLPILGIGLVLIPASLWMILTGKVITGIVLLIFYLFLSLGVEYFLKPKIVGDKVQMHTLIVFLAIMGGLSMFGILGIIYGPLIATFFLTLTDIYNSNYREMVTPNE